MDWSFPFLRRSRRADDAGRVSRAVNAASAKWPDDPRTLSATADIRAAAGTVSQRVAGLYLNSPPVRSAANLLVSYIAGAGVRVNTPDQEMDRAFNSARLDPSRLMSATALQRAAVRSWVISGEVLGLHRVVDGAYAFQLLDPAQLDATKTEDLGAGGSIIAGVERDAMGAIRAYWLLPHAPGDPFATATASVRVPAADVVHVFELEFPGQVRGISPLAPVLGELHHADIALEARLRQLQVSAMLTVILTSPDGTDPFDGEANPSLEPGAIIRARPGEEVETVNGPQSPDFNAFVKVIFRQIAAALGVTYEDLLGDLEGVNYSSFRGGALTARRKAEALRKVLLIEGFLEPVFSRWLAIERLAGRAGADLVPAWIEPAWPQIDPQKEAAADIAQLDAGLKSRREIIEARGREFATVVAEIAGDEARPRRADAARDTADDAADDAAEDAA